MYIQKKNQGLKPQLAGKNPGTVSKITNNSRLAGDNDDMDVETILSTFREDSKVGQTFYNESNSNMRDIQTLLEINPKTLIGNSLEPAAMSQINESINGKSLI